LHIIFQPEWPKKSGAAIFGGSKVSVNNEMHLKAFSCCDKICSTEMRFAGRSGMANPLKLMCVHKQGARGLELNFGNLSSCHIDIDEVLVPPN